jgi:hypothetical protein
MPLVSSGTQPAAGEFWISPADQSPVPFVSGTGGVADLN